MINQRYSLLSHYCVAYSCPLCTNMTSSIQPEVRNAAKGDRAADTSNMRKNSVKIVYVVPEICWRTDRHGHHTAALACRRRSDCWNDVVTVSMRMACVRRDDGRVLRVRALQRQLPLARRATLHPLGALRPHARRQVRQGGPRLCSAPTSYR